ncbi:hypothetical protein B0T16DRAFT_463070 [Cercophora newfieldiana]|uniref:VWFA domain-containing protein n=1 Tax=Cercophora newfieldiana TaxID=92897 RepID=A0AA39XTZ6_9PEZI|nr:hypothetical protein B0T16DRAFT_463070 [Cercophora newfieldiana]
MRFSVTAALACAFTRQVLGDPGISPASVEQKADPESSFQITKTVITPEIPPKPDVVLLVDVTSSMGGAINNIKSKLNTIIDSVKATQPNAQFAVASFGDLRDRNGFQVNQDLTDRRSALQTAVNGLRAEFGLDRDEDWIYALHKLSTGSITFRDGSSRIIVLVGDAPSHDPSGPPTGEKFTLAAAISALFAKNIRVIGVNVSGLDLLRQAIAVTSATGGTLLPSTSNEVAAAIVSGLSNLRVTVTPSPPDCSHPGISISFNPPAVIVLSGSTVSFTETVSLAKDVPQGTTLSCTTQFRLNGQDPGVSFQQTVSTPVNILGCDLCDPRPGKNLCHGTTSCAPTPYGTMCLTRPGFKADGVKDDENRKQWRLKWKEGGHEHRVAVKPGLSADTFCDRANVGKDVYWLRALGAGDLKSARDDSSLVGLVLGRTEDECWDPLGKYTSLATVEPDRTSSSPSFPTVWIMFLYRASSEDVYQRVTVLEAKLRRPWEAYDMEKDLGCTFQEVKIVSGKQNPMSASSTQGLCKAQSAIGISLTTVLDLLGWLYGRLELPRAVAVLLKKASMPCEPKDSQAITAINRVKMPDISGKQVGAIGFGMLGLTKPWDPVEYLVATKVMKTALEQGANFWNGGTHYGTLDVIKYYFEQYPDDAGKVCLSIKGAFDREKGPDGSPEGIRASVDYALGVLDGVKTIDVFELARVDPSVPIETSVKALGELVQQEKVGVIGLSEVSAVTIRKAHAMHRRMLPRFQPDVFEQNFKLVEAVEAIAKRKGVTTAQIAIGWVCRQGAMPIPGSIKVGPEEIQKILDKFPISGLRYGGAQEKFLNA